MPSDSKRHMRLGKYGESAVCVYLGKLGFTIVTRNVRYRTGELDIVAVKANTLHIIEVKTAMCADWRGNIFNPAWNLHPLKVRKVARTAEWHIAATEWKGEWQIDGALVLVREHDHVARISYYPQIVV